ncbi:lipid-A-disaccharide synthase [Mangrovimonas sp. YM274]|uniref:lipid-A-disaccharide synthase n=1 Tax=Mangrovimonas sp. YM274 TaxID=3070660 RepID=UPI0027DB0897|nr:lipid-A-disaccharide synthase [Mangrovimonas sp. YM274]WMI68489.1 lipid-A-disaccharide synthase [Mangrovimonas sp. YM274]
MKYYIIAGEASGDLHGSNLMKALSQLDVNAEFRFWGGDLMQQVSDNLVKHYKDLAFMGFAEVIMNLRTIANNLSFCKKDIAAFQPDTIIFIDYPGFNMRIAKWAKKEGIRTQYYISPQIWAWKENRIHAIKRDVDNMYVILPFEKDFYKKHQYHVEFVGHPLIDAIGDRTQVDEYVFRAEHGLTDKPIIALLPGSRKQEIKKMLSVMLSIVDDFPKYQFVIAGAPSQERSFYQGFIKKANVAFVSNETYDLLSVSYAALVTSGTATLETALFKIPEVVCYKGSWLSYQIGKRLVKHIKYISLVNLIMDKEVVTELIQDDFTTARLKEELNKILDDYERVKFFLDYYDLEKQLGGKGASQNAAKLIFKDITKNH